MNVRTQIGRYQRAFDAIRNDYDAAKINRFRRQVTGYSPLGSGADYHYRNESQYLKLGEYAWDLYRNNIVVGQGVDRLVNLVLRDGPRLNMLSPDPQFNDRIEQTFQDWAEDPARVDVSGRHTLHQLTKQALRAVLVPGDIFFNPTSEGSLEGIESHRSRTPSNTKKNVVHGIMIDSRRRPVEYWFTKDNLDPNKPLHRVGDTRAYPAWTEEGDPAIYHVLNPKRYTQTRGVTALAPIVDPSIMLDDLSFAHLVKAQAASAITFLHTYSEDYSGTLPDAYGATTTETMPDGTTRTIEDLAPGLNVFGAPGESIDAFSPNIPNAEFFEHALLILTFIAINLGIPVHILLLDPSRTNFSGWRGAMDAAKPGLRELLNDVIVARFLKPVVRWKIRQWAAEDRDIRAIVEEHGAAAFRHEWVPPRIPYIEPNKDATAEALIIAQDLDSIFNVHKARGLDTRTILSDNVRASAMRIELAIEAANALNETYPDAGITWRDLVVDPDKAVTLTARNQEVVNNADPSE